MLSVTYMLENFRVELSMYVVWREGSKNMFLQISRLIILSQVTWWMADRPNKQTKLNPFFFFFFYIHRAQYWQSRLFLPWVLKISFLISPCRAKEYETAMEAKAQVPDSPYKAK